MATSRWALESQFNARIEKERAALEARQLQEALDEISEQRAYDMIDAGLAYEAEGIEFPGY